jgi:hypothetical protein
MVASGFFNEVPARDAVASLSHRRAANKCGAAILPFDSGTALGWKKTIVGSEAVAIVAHGASRRPGLPRATDRPRVPIAHGLSSSANSSYLNTTGYQFPA